MLAHHYYQGETHWGGYFIIKNLLLNPAADQRAASGNAAELQYLDLYMVIGGLEASEFEYLKGMNSTEQPEPLCCFANSDASQPSVQPLVNGLVRAVVYTKNDWGVVSNVQVMVEGNIREGEI